ncbi:MAG TPA: hypothetical protein VK362_08390 [Reyranella sp.]|nr:hypothetical protein [Reyranella sp.]
MKRTAAANVHAIRPFVPLLPPGVPAAPAPEPELLQRFGLIRAPPLRTATTSSHDGKLRAGPAAVAGET